MAVLACPVCGVVGRPVIEPEGIRTYHFCSGCEYVWLDPSDRVSSDWEKARYELHNNDSDQEGYVRWLTDFWETAVHPFFRPRMRILDFGCGPGPVLGEIMERHGARVALYDRYFRPRMPSGRFDIITSTEVLEHLADPVGVLTDLEGRLADGGIISLMTYFRPPGGEEAFFSWWYRRDETHIGFFREPTLAVLADRTGLAVRWSDGRRRVVMSRSGGLPEGGIRGMNGTS